MNRQERKGPLGLRHSHYLKGKEKVGIVGVVWINCAAHDLAVTASLAITTAHDRGVAGVATNDPVAARGI